MKDREARDRIEILERCLGITEMPCQFRLGFFKGSRRFKDFSDKLNALMTHLNLEFEEVQPGIRVKKK